MKITATKITTIDDAHRAIAATMPDGFEAKATLAQIYGWGHSVTRSQLFEIKMGGIPSFVSTHLVRHKIGVEHFVQSKRDDRCGDKKRSDTYAGKTAEYFRELFYEKDGKLYWRVSRTNKIKVGAEAGCVMNTGYWQIMVDNKTLLRHRIIFGMSSGFFPKYLDHIDRTRTNDRPENLRESSQSFNGANSGKRSNNTTGFKGVGWRKDTRRWTAKIKVDYRTKNLGCFDTAEQAAKAYDKAASLYFGDFAGLNFPIPHRMTPTNHMMLINAEALMTMAHRRLCYKASPETREVMEGTKKAMAFVDPDLARHLVPQCVFRGGYCSEPKPCGNYLVRRYDPTEIMLMILPDERKEVEG